MTIASILIGGKIEKIYWREIGFGVRNVSRRL